MLKTFKLSMFRYYMAALLAVVVSGILSPVADAQEQGGAVSGVITDNQGPVAGAAVMIKGGSGGVMTGVDGDYVLTGVKSGDIIVVSLLGYEELEIPYIVIEYKDTDNFKKFKQDVKTKGSRELLSLLPGPVPVSIEM